MVGLSAGAGRLSAIGAVGGVGIGRRTAGAGTVVGAAGWTAGAGPGSRALAVGRVVTEVRSTAGNGTTAAGGAGLTEGTVRVSPPGDVGGTAGRSDRAPQVTAAIAKIASAEPPAIIAPRFRRGAGPGAPDKKPWAPVKRRLSRSAINGRGSGCL